jgi:hypothetical protein
MASTTLMPLDPAMSPQRVNRVLSISADLLPDEIVASRRARRSRAWVVVALGLVVVLLGSWFAWADHHVQTANDDLSDVTAQATTLQKSQTKYQEVVGVQRETSSISRQLTSLMAQDLRWGDLLDTLRNTGSTAGVSVGGVTAKVNQESAAASATLPHPGVTTIGTVTITGTTTGGKPAIAKYLDGLADLDQVSDPYLTNANEGDKKL